MTTSRQLREEAGELLARIGDRLKRAQEHERFCGGGQLRAAHRYVQQLDRVFNRAYWRLKRRQRRELDELRERRVS